MSPVSLSPSITIPRSLVPQGAEVIRSSVVDIYPMSGITAFNTTRRDPQLPVAMGREESAIYLEKLVAERDFLVTRLRKNIPELPLSGGVEAVHQFFIDHGLAKLGLRNITLQGGVLSAEHCLVTHPAYSLYSESSNPLLREFGANLGAALILTTSDGKLLIQHRKPENRVYGDVPGASIAGLVDAPKGPLDRLDMLQVGQSVMLAEGREEVGFAPDVTEEFTFTGLHIDKAALHHEMTFTSRTSRTSDEIATAALANQHKNDPAAFSENIVFLDSTPQVVARLLTDIRTPFPMTHAGPLLMLGYQLMKDTKPVEASSWLHSAIAAMDENYRVIDTLSADGRYSPGKSATAQGLPSFKDELQRVFRGEHRYVECGK